MKVDYSKGKIYRIVCNVTGLQYFGSNCEPTLAKRLVYHRSGFKRWMSNNQVSCCLSRKVLENNDFSIVLVENYPCENKEELHSRERFYIECNECVNKQVPTRSKNEWYLDNQQRNLDAKKIYYATNKVKLQMINKVYKQNNVEKMKISSLNYRLQNKERINFNQKQKILCSCGKTISKSHKLRHESSDQHKEYITQALLNFKRPDDITLKEYVFKL